MSRSGSVAVSRRGSVESLTASMRREDGWSTLSIMVGSAGGRDDTVDHGGAPQSRQNDVVRRVRGGAVAMADGMRVLERGKRLGAPLGARPARPPSRRRPAE